MATSIASGGVSWAVLPMSADPAFWEVFARAGNSGAWKLVTPPGVADNGGLVAAVGGAKSLTVAMRPSQDLVFSPLAKPGAIAASPAGKRCGGAVRVTSISFGITGADLLAGGTCGTSGAAAVFAYSPGGGWQRLSLPVPGPVVRLTDGMALVRGKSGLAALWRATGWYAYAPVAPAAPQPAAAGWTESAPLPLPGPVLASGPLSLGAVWVLLADGRAATVSALGTTSGRPQWRLAVNATAWTQVQRISVPVQLGSSG